MRNQRDQCLPRTRLRSRLPLPSTLLRLSIVALALAVCRTVCRSRSEDGPVRDDSY